MSNQNSNPSGLDDDIVKIHSIKCEKCLNIINVPIKKSDIDSAIGGIFRIVVIHQCMTDRMAIFLFFDKHLAIRQKVVSQVTVTDLQEGALLDRATLSPVRKFASFNFLQRKIKEEISKVVFGVIIGQQIVFAGDRSEVEPSCEGITIFTPHRNLVIESWATTESDADIVGTTLELTPNYKEALVVDLEKNVVYNGIKNDFCLMLVQKLMEYTDGVQAVGIIEGEINRIVNYVKEYSSVESIDEAETFLAALALDGVDQNLLEIILPLSAQINPAVSEYYRKHLSIIEGESDELPPNRVWFIQGNGQKVDRLLISQLKDNINFREGEFINRIRRTMEVRSENEHLFELFTPMDHYIVTFWGDKGIASLFPRVADGEKPFIKTLAIHNSISDEINTLQNKELLEYLMIAFLEQKMPRDIIPAVQQYVVARKTLPFSNDHSILERHYIQTNACQQDLRLVITKTIEAISSEVGNLQPKIIRLPPLTIIKETLMSLIAGESNIEDKIDLGFNFAFYIQPPEKKSRIDIILEFFVRSNFYKLGLDTGLAFNLSYMKFSDLIKKVLEECQKDKSFVGI